MKFILTPEVLHFLIAEGYTHCVSKSQIVEEGTVRYSISLIPVREKPVFSKHKLLFVTLFNIKKELSDMTSGVEHARVWVVLGNDDVVKLKQHFLELAGKRGFQGDGLLKRQVPNVAGHKKRTV